MWMAFGVVGEVEGDGAACEHDEREGVLGDAESVGSADDEADLVVEAFMASVREASGDGGVDSVEVGSDGFADLGELRDSAALRPGAPVGEHGGDGLVVEVACEDSAQ
jgi:hypothetical protein